MLYTWSAAMGPVNRKAATVPWGKAELLHVHHSCRYASTSAIVDSTRILEMLVLLVREIIRRRRGCGADSETVEVVVRSSRVRCSTYFTRRLAYCVAFARINQLSRVTSHKCSLHPHPSHINYLPGSEEEHPSRRPRPMSSKSGFKYELLRPRFRRYCLYARSEDSTYTVQLLRHVHRGKRPCLWYKSGARPGHCWSQQGGSLLWACHAS